VWYFGRASRLIFRRMESNAIVGGVSWYVDCLKLVVASWGEFGVVALAASPLFA